MKCPKCLMKERKYIKAYYGNTALVDKKLSIVCNASPIAWTAKMECACGADWIPENRL